MPPSPVLCKVIRSPLMAGLHKTEKKTAKKRAAKKPRRRIVVESRSIEGVNYQRELVTCGKPKCKRCRVRAAHGPYWYAYYWRPASLPARRGSPDVAGRLVSAYIGKEFGLLSS